MARNLALHAACLSLVCLALLAQDSQLPPAGTTVRVRLQAPLTTKFNRKGDMVSARVVDPPGFAGALMEGEIHDLKAGAAGKESAIQFEFHTFHAGGKPLPISAAVIEISNSKHESGVDENGTALDAGGRGAAKKGGGVTTQLTAKGDSISLASGSELVLKVQPRSAR